jgi:hypothetical protein
VHACTSGSYQDPKDTQAYISWRLLDLPPTYFNSMAWIPTNIGMQLLPVDGKSTYSALGKSIKV